MPDLSRNAAVLPPGCPQHFSRAEGCHPWDVEGNRYVGLMCSWGPVIFGHKHPAVEAAGRAPMAAEKLLERSLT